MAISGSFSGSAGKLQLNGAMLGGIIVDNANGRFEGLAGGSTGSYDVTLNTNINNRNLIAALNSVYDSAAGNEPGGTSGSIQTNDNDGGFAGSNFKYELGHFAILEGAQELQFRDSALKISSSGDTYLDISSDNQINLTGTVKANGALHAAGNVSGTLAGTFLNLSAGNTAFAVSKLGAVNGLSLAVDDGGTIGTDSDADMLTLTNDSNITLASDIALRFADAGEAISRPGDGYLALTAGTEVQVTGALQANGIVSGTLAGQFLSLSAGNTAFGVSKLGAINGLSLAVDDGGTIGTDSDADMLTLTNDSNITLASDIALRFADAGEAISRPGDGYLALTAGTEVQVTGALQANGIISGTLAGQFLELSAGNTAFSVSKLGAVTAVGVAAGGAITTATTIDASGEITGGGFTDGTMSIGSGAGTGFVSVSTNATGFMSGAYMHASELLQGVAGGRTELSGALHVSGASTFSQAVIFESTQDTKGQAIFRGTSVFGDPTGANSTLTLMGTNAAGSPTAYRLSVTGGILSVQTAQ